MTTPIERVNDSDSMRLFILLNNFLGYSGVLLFCYGYLNAFYLDRYEPFELIAEPLLVVLGVVGVLITVLGAYLPENKRPTEGVSKKYIAPAVVLASLVSIAFYFFPDLILLLANKLGKETPGPISLHVFNGLSIVGLSGAIFRTLSR